MPNYSMHRMGTAFARRWEWLNSWGSELKDMGRIVGVFLLVQLPGIESEEEKDQGVAQRIRAARETTRLAPQTGQIVAQFSIISFHGVGVGLALGDGIATRIVAQMVIDSESITMIHFRGWPLVDDLLHVLDVPFPDHIAANKAAGTPVHLGYDVDLVFLSPIKVNNSSNSAVSTSLGVGIWLILLAYSATHKETVR